MAMSKMEKIGYGIAGGLLGAGVVAGISAGIAYNKWKTMGAFLPMSLELKTNASTPSTLPVYAYITKKKDSNMACLTIEPFKAMASGVFNTAASLPLLPIQFVPIAAAEPVKVEMHDSEGQLAIAANGQITLVSAVNAADKGAWGLAKEARIYYPVASM